MQTMGHQIKRLKEIVENLKQYLDVIKQWKPRDEATAFHIRRIEELLATNEGN